MNFAVLNLNILRRSVQNISVRCANLADFDDRSGFQIGNRNIAGGVRDINSVRIADVFPAAVRHFECDAGKRLIVRSFDVFMNHKNRKRLVVEDQTVAVAGIRKASASRAGCAGGHPIRAGSDLNCPGRAVEDISFHRPRFPYHQRHAGRQSGQDNLSVFIRDVFAVADPRSVRIRNQERDAGERFCGSVDILLNRQGLQGNIAERQGLRVVGVDRDGLRFAVESVSVRGFRFRHHIRAGFKIHRR